MKNFFKKLALVLALALVVTVVAPAAASNSEAASVALTAKSAKVSIGKSYDFNLKNKVKGSTYKWTSSNKKVATVNAKNGLTKGVAVGTATISCKITMPNKTTKTVKGTITVCPDATAVAINTSKFDTTKMVTGGSYDFDRTMTPSNSVNKTYWIVKDATGTEVANTRTGVGADLMTSAGVFKPVKPGAYTVQAVCYRSKTAAVLRAQSEVMTVNVALKEVTKLEVEDVTLFTDTDGQILKAKADDKEMTAADLATAGYKVTFNASDNGLLASAAKTNQTGIVVKQAVATTYTYSVTIQKGSTILESNKAKVTVLDKSKTAASAITSVKLKSDDIAEIKSGKIAMTSDTNVQFSEIIATLMDNRTSVDMIALGAPLTYETSDATVATVAADGKITAKAPGKVTLTIKSGTVSYPVNLEIVAANSRKLSKIEYTGKPVSLALSATKTVGVVAYDQYGDTFKTTSISVTPVAATSNGKAIATAAVTAASGNEIKGKANVAITADSANTGSGLIEIYKDSTRLGSISVTVVKATTGEEVKVDLSADTIDLSAGSIQKEIKVSLNKYVNGTSLAGTETIEGITIVDPNGKEIDCDSINNDTITRATLITGDKTKADADVTVAAVAEKVPTGKYAVEVTYDTDKTAHGSFTVTNSAPYLSSVTLNKVDVKVNGLKLSDIITAANASSSAYDGVLRYAADGSDKVYVYINKAATPNTYAYADGDYLLGYITATNLAGSATCNFTAASAPYAASGVGVTLGNFDNGGKIQIDVKSMNGNNIGRLVLE